MPAEAGPAAFVLRTDGGARGNPGPAGAGFVLEDPAGLVVAAAGRYIGETTNNVAEYEALLWGLRTALAQGVREIQVYSDSQLVVRQLNGQYRVKHENMKPLFVEAMQLLRRFGAWRADHVERAANSAADALVNEAIDARAEVGHLGLPVADDECGPGQGTLFGEEG